MIEKYYEKRQSTIKKWYEGHIATIKKFDDDNLMKIIWKNPKYGTDSVIYVIDFKYATLCVYGDLGDAIYCFKEIKNLEFLKDLDLAYFCSKNSASSNELHGKTWDPVVAEHFLNEYLKEYEETESLKKLSKEEKQDFLNDCLSACQNKEEWHFYIHNSGYNFLGDYEMLYHIGEVISIRTQSHLIGLKMVIESLQKDPKP